MYTWNGQVDLRGTLGQAISRFRRVRGDSSQAYKILRSVVTVDKKIMFSLVGEPRTVVIALK